MARNRSQADSFTLRAKKEGYPARSVYKLEEIQRRLAIISPTCTVLDIGASPGSWSLFIHRRLLGKGGKLIAVDIKPLELNPMPKGISFIQGDAFQEPAASEITSRGPYDAVVSDAAPETTGNRTVDTARSQELAQSVIFLSDTILAQGGNLLVKVFQGGGERELLDQLKSRFFQAKIMKPKASRDESFEVFLAGMNKK